MRRRGPPLIFLIIFVLIGAPAWAKTYYGAAGRVDITPDVGAYLAGYGPNRVSTGTIDPLWAHVLIVADEHQQLVMISLDNIGLTRPHVQDIRRRVGAVLPRSHVVVSSSHTHAGPDVVGIWGPALWQSGRDEHYLDKTAIQIANLAAQLGQDLVPVSLHVGSADADFAWVNNLSEPQLIDPKVTVLQLRNLAGSSIATVTNFACHPTVLGPENTRVSADYVAGFYRTMRAALPGEHLFVQGAIGGWVQPEQGNRSSVLANRLGHDVAEFARTLLGRTELVDYSPLHFREQLVDIPLESWGFKLLIGLGVIERQLIGNALQGMVGAGDMRTSVAYFRLGQLGFVTHPGETSPYYSLVSRKLAVDRHLMVMGLTQDAIGYILKPDYFDQPHEYPHADYLIGVSVGRQAGPLLIQAVGELMATGSSLKKRKSE
ncbi:MAG: neutral/alkaline non-lysosomal ceramidase N-terminal domain-containing protein [Pseudomonadota bacterium]